MYLNIINKLNGYKLECNKVVRNTIDDIEFIFDYEFPEDYKNFLSNIETSIRFKNDIYYKPIEITSDCDEDGTQMIDVLFGLNCSYNIIDENNKFSGIIPNGYIAIGGSNDVDLVVLNKKNGMIYFLNHEAIYHNEMLFKIANNFNEFIITLFVKEVDNSNDYLGQIDRESSTLSEMDIFVAKNEKLMKKLRKL